MDTNLISNEVLGDENCPGKALQIGVFGEAVARNLAVHSRSGGSGEAGLRLWA